MHISPQNRVLGHNFWEIDLNFSLSKMSLKKKLQLRNTNECIESETCSDFGSSSFNFSTLHLSTEAKHRFLSVEERKTNDKFE